jgi:hypothetical protein
MQSAAKCPFLLTFNCVRYCGPDKDFENRKKLKKSNQYCLEADSDMESIREE